MGLSQIEEHHNVAVLHHQPDTGGLMAEDISSIMAQLRMLAEQQKSLGAKMDHLNSEQQKEAGAMPGRERRIEVLEKEVAEHDDLIRELHSVIRALKWMAALLGVGGTTIGAAANSILGG